MSLRSNQHHRFTGISLWGISISVLKNSKFQKIAILCNFSEKSGEAKGCCTSFEFTLWKHLIAIFVNGSEVCTEMCDFLATVWQLNLCKGAVGYTYMNTLSLMLECLRPQVDSYLHRMHFWKASMLPWSFTGLTCLLWACRVIPVGLGWILNASSKGFIGWQTNFRFAGETGPHCHVYVTIHAAPHGCQHCGVECTKTLCFTAFLHL